MKRFLKVFVLLMMVVALTGCMKLNVNVEVKSDASMTMNMEMLMEESMLTLSGQSVDEAIKQMEDQMKSTDGMETAKFTPVSKTISGKKWAGFTVEGDASDSKTLVKEEVIDGQESLVVTLPMDTLTSGLGEQLDPSQFAAQGYSLDKMKELGVEMNVVITMPNKAKSSVGTVDGNKVTVDLLEMSVSGKTQDIVVSSAKSSGLPLGLIFGGIAAVAIVVALVVILKKKKKTPEAITVEGTPVEPMNTAPIVEETPVEPITDTSVGETTEVVEEKTEEVTESTPETKTEESTDKKFCPNCGFEIKEDGIEFCPNCGAKIEK